MIINGVASEYDIPIVNTIVKYGHDTVQKVNNQDKTDKVDECIDTFDDMLPTTPYIDVSGYYYETDRVDN